jgi:hypothetical protein
MWIDVPTACAIEDGWILNISNKASWEGGKILDPAVKLNIRLMFNSIIRLNLLSTIINE